MIDSSPIPRERPGVGRHDQLGNFQTALLGRITPASTLDSDAAAADVLADYEARIAALERLVGKLALENEFLKGASRHVRQPRSASTSVIAGPVVSQSQKDVG